MGQVRVRWGPEGLPRLSLDSICVQKDCSGCRARTDQRGQGRGQRDQPENSFICLGEKPSRESAMSGSARCLGAEIPRAGGWLVWMRAGEQGHRGSSGVWVVPKDDCYSPCAQSPCPQGTDIRSPDLTLEMKSGLSV